MTGCVVAIYTSGSAQAPMRAVDEAFVEAGKGLAGDRYYRRNGRVSDELERTRDSEITLIESEEITRFNETEGLDLGLGALRRNIVTRGIGLNTLVDRRFRVGEVWLEGIRLCEPCAHLAKLVTPRVLPGLVHRAGLRACIVAGGTIRTGDAVIVES